MLRDPELLALIEQAARNLDTLELIVRGVRENDEGAIKALRQRLHSVKLAYARETNALTREVLARAVERRSGERRRGAAAASEPELETKP
jgi:hypothetical protein